MTITREAAAQARAAATATVGDRPRQRRMGEESWSAAKILHPTPVERGSIKEMQRDGQTVVRVSGYASVTETPYEIWDMFGPYSEIVSRGAFGKTLASSPLVEFTINHGAGGGIPMAHTRNGMLDLSEDETGLRYDAYVDPLRTDVQDVLRAIDRGDLAEASFKFRIESGVWSPDYTEYRIDQVDLNRGDVSAVNFGANPAATSTLRNHAPATARDMDSLVHPLTLRQKALYEAIEGVAEVFGMFDQTSGPDGAHYMPASPFVAEGMACANCAFYDGPRGCEVVAGDIDPGAVCKFWVIPADLMTGPPAAARAARNTDYLRARLSLAIVGE